MNRLTTTARMVSISEIYRDVAIASQPARPVLGDRYSQQIEYVVAPQGTAVPFPRTFHPSTERERIRAALVAAGLSTPPPSMPVAGQLTVEQREELARRVSAGTPLSQIIDEERHGR